MRRTPHRALTALLMFPLTACGVLSTPTPSPVATPTATTGTPTATPAPTTTPSAPVPASAEPTATPAPPLSLDSPAGTDPRVVSVAVEPNVGAEGGELRISVTSLSDERIDELVLRWPTELRETLFLAPFVPSEERIREGGPPLIQEWTKWVVGPGEQGEPAGTTSLGWGPLLPGATLQIRLVVERGADGAVAFDLQVLAGNDLLTLEGDAPAELRVEIP